MLLRPDGVVTQGPGRPSSWKIGWESEGQQACWVLEMVFDLDYLRLLYFRFQVMGDEIG